MLQVKVLAIRDEAIDIRGFELGRADGERLPAFAPGSHIDIHLGEGLIRQYSLCGMPNETETYQIAVKREPLSRGGSKAMHESVHVGGSLFISEPRNNFPLRDTAGPTLLIAGGIGITPMLAMARQLQRSGREFALHYFSRSIAHTAFHATLSERQFLGKVSFHYALEVDAVRAYLRKLLWQRPTDGHLYLCGPRPFMDLVETTAAATWPPDAVHLEYFAADPASLSGPRDSFTVRLARSGGEYLIPPDKSIVIALAEQGIEIPTSCEQGVCGTCLTGVLEGIPDHRDVFLMDAEKAACDKMTPCVSRAHSDTLVLDL
jgi:vanillate O-demethylase ferredoxin subunit